MTGAADNSAAIVAVLDAIEQVRRAFGAPGDHGYETREGQALYKLYMPDQASMIWMSRSATCAPTHWTPLPGPPPGEGRGGRA